MLPPVSPSLSQQRNEKGAWPLNALCFRFFCRVILSVSPRKVEQTVSPRKVEQNKIHLILDARDSRKTQRVDESGVHGISNGRRLPSVLFREVCPRHKARGSLEERERDKDGDGPWFLEDSPGARGERHSNRERDRGSLWKGEHQCPHHTCTPTDTHTHNTPDTTTHKAHTRLHAHITTTTHTPHTPHTHECLDMRTIDNRP